MYKLFWLKYQSAYQENRHLISFIYRHYMQWIHKDVFIKWVLQNKWPKEDYKAVLALKKYNTWYNNIGIPSDFHTSCSMLNFARYCPWRIEMWETVSFFLSKWINGFNTGKFRRWELSKSRFFGFLLLFMNYLNTRFRHRHRFDGFIYVCSRF